MVAICATASDIGGATLGTDVGETAPDFTAKDLNGKTVKLSDFRDLKVVLLVVGASW